MKEHSILKKYIFWLVMIAVSIIAPLNGVNAMNIVAGSNFAFWEDIGFINLAPSIPEAVEVTGTGIVWDAWSTNFGFIDFSPTNGWVTLENRFVGQACTSILSGEAWSTNLGWIDFDNVTIDSAGIFRWVASGINSGDIFFEGENIVVATTLLPDCTGQTPPPIAQTGWWTSPRACRDENAINFQRFGRADNSLCIFEDEPTLPVVPVVVNNQDEAEEEDPITAPIPVPDQVEEQEEKPSTPVPTSLPTIPKAVASISIENDFRACSIIDQLTGDNIPSKTGVFIDESSFNFSQSIGKFAQTGIVSGFADGSFGPKKNITRAEFLKVVLQTHCIEYDDEDTSNLKFIDVDIASWQARVISRAQGLGIINGDVDSAGNPVFRQNDVISKIEALKILLNLSKIASLNPQSLQYNDITVDWHAPYAITAQSLGLFNPEKDNWVFSPNEGVSREDMVNLIDRLVVLYRT